MDEEVLHPSVSEFIACSVRSVEQLEILSLLSARPQESWSVKDVFARIQSSEQAIAQSLHSFVQAGLLKVEADGSYRFAPKDAKHVSLMAQLREAYQQRPVTVIQTIYATRPPVESPPIHPPPP